MIHLSLPIIIAFLVVGASAQDLPKKIRGYKVHDEIISLSNQNPVTAGNTVLVIGEPKVASISFGGVTLAIAGGLESAGYDGRVEMLTFHDFRINGVPVDVAESKTPFTINKHGTTALPSPANVFLSTSDIISSAWKEITDSKDDWSVTGRVFVFGKFRKLGFSFKRVVPVDVRLIMKNPLLEYRKSALS